MIGSWNVTAEAYGKKEGWDEDEMTAKQVIVMTVTVLGAAIGSLFSGYLAFIGRWSCLLISNAVIVAGAGLTIIPDFGALCTGRFIYGLGVGAFSVFVPKYIAETAPIEIKGPAGALT
jgi:MFS transporter, SP family, arabinose:H+ symporter